MPRCQPLSDIVGVIRFAAVRANLSLRGWHHKQSTGALPGTRLRRMVSAGDANVVT
jgi:hypothetical protein